MPYCVTMARAIFVARSRSFEAPVVMSSQKISSATRPPMNTASSSRISPSELSTLSSLGMDSVYPSARPREMMLILCTGSACGSRCPTRAWPLSW